MWGGGSSTGIPDYTLSQEREKHLRLVRQGSDKPEKECGPADGRTRTGEGDTERPVAGFCEAKEWQ